MARSVGVVSAEEGDLICVQRLLLLLQEPSGEDSCKSGAFLMDPGACSSLIRCEHTVVSFPGTKRKG